MRSRSIDGRAAASDLRAASGMVAGSPGGRRVLIPSGGA